MFRYGPRSILLLLLCLLAALLPIFVRRRWLRATLPTRPSAEQPAAAAGGNADDTVILVGADSPRNRAARQQSVGGVVSRQHLNGSLSGEAGELQT